MMQETQADCKVLSCLIVKVSTKSSGYLPFYNNYALPIYHELNVDVSWLRHASAIFDELDQ